MQEWEVCLSAEWVNSNQDQISIIIIVCWEPYVVSQSTAASSASCKHSRPPSNFVNGQELTCVTLSSQ